VLHGDRPRGHGLKNVSLYIPCYNVVRFLKHSIEAALEQTIPPAEIIIVDDGSSDETLQIAAAYPVRIVRHKRNRGLAAARNTGVTSARNELVASIDADCVPKPDWLEKLLDCMDDETVAGAGGQLVERNRTRLPDLWRSVHMAQSHGPDRIANPPFIFGHGTVFRKSALEKVGLYNKKLRTNAEDIYISERLKKTGFTVVYQPAAVVEHLRTDTLSSLVRAYWAWNFHGYLQDVTFYNTVRTSGHKLIKGLPALVAEDLRHGRWECALVSSLVIGYSVIADMIYYMGHRGQKRLFDV
jgi:GT2 family glycosyltransferase